MTKAIYEAPVTFKPAVNPNEIDPVEEATSYVNHNWFQQLISCRTQCFRCKKDSPIVHAPYDGVLAFGNPRMLRRGNQRIRDITRDVQMEFAKHGWKFQLKRSYCPDCKGLGSV